MNKEQLIEKHRDINVEYHGWYEHVYECFKEDMRAMGIDVKRIYFSGFWSQGDGACFEGHVADWKLFLKSIGYHDPVLLGHADENWQFSVKHHGHYYHEHCTSFDSRLPMPVGYDGDEFIYYFCPYEDDLRSLAWVNILRQFEKYDFDDDCTNAFKSHMRDLYRALEKEHEYLTSDEVVWETLEANDMTDELEETT